MYYLDTETVGLHGQIVLMQYAKDEGDIVLYEPWRNKVQDTLYLIERICYEGVIAFNAVFDWHMICKMYTSFLLLRDKQSLPSIQEVASIQKEAVFGPCLKPSNCFDVMLHARKGPYQSTMDRKDIRIKRVPTPLAYKLARELDKRITLKNVYFSRKKDPKKRWSVQDIEKPDGTIDPSFKTLVLKFAPSSALKALASDALNLEEVIRYNEINLPKHMYPEEYGYIPTLTNWAKLIPSHIHHWATNKEARQYASDDIKYTRALYHHFGDPELNDDDSVLAFMVGAIRWHGYKLDLDKLSKLRDDRIAAQTDAEFSYRSSAGCRKYLTEVMTDTEQKALIPRNSKVPSTKKIVLEAIAKWRESKGVCDGCNGYGCDLCTDGFILSDVPHPAAIRARRILDLRKGDKEIELFDKLLKAGRFHASFKIIGTLSSRMSGSDGLNPQGINKRKEVRECFPLADDSLVLCGGDFDAFEVTIMDAAYNDPLLHEELLAGKSIHGLFGMMLFPPLTYEQIMATKPLPEELNRYGRSKNCVFALFYGGDANTLVNRGGVDLQAAERAYQRWCERYQVWGEKRKIITNMFCSMRQPDGMGTRVQWSEPAEYIESFLGFKRFFTLENRIAHALFNLAEDPPADWQKLKLKVTRHDREQTACGAVRSALFGSAFAIQGANTRAAANHVIQSAGAQITKALQRRLWDLQPAGINEWMILPMNIHDEILAPCKPALIPDTHRVVSEFVEEYRKKVPLLSVGWKDHMSSWAAK